MEVEKLKNHPNDGKIHHLNSQALPKEPSKAMQPKSIPILNLI